MVQLQLPTDFLRVSPIDLSSRVAGGSPSGTTLPAQIAGVTDAGRCLSFGQVGVSGETPYLSSSAREASAATALAGTLSEEVSR